MTSIDQRVVEMQFDNAAFERGIDQTLRSLKQLDNALNVEQEVSGFDKIRNVISNLRISDATNEVGLLGRALDGIKNTAEHAFSSVLGGVGNVVKGIGLIKGLLGAGVAGIAIQGGWNRASNINMAEFKLKSLLKDEALVEMAMDNASKAVTNTAYSMDSAAVAAANLTASGVEAGEELGVTLKTISGLASVSGRDYDSVANIMGAIASQGKLMGMQVQQFSLSGLNVLAPLAEAFGTTEEAIRDMVSEGEIDFKTFRDIMAENFADQAFKANETLTGVTANLKAALARSTADLFQYGQNAVVPVIDNIRLIVNTLNGIFKPIMGMTDEGPGLFIKTFQEMAKGAAQALSDWNNLSVGPERFAALVERIVKTISVPLRDLRGAAYDLTYIALDIAGIFREAWRIVMEYLKPIQNAFNATFGKKNISKGAAGLKEGLDSILDFLNNFTIPEEHFKRIYDVFRLFFGGIKEVVFDNIGPLIRWGRPVIKSIIDALSSTGEFLANVGGTIISTLSAIFAPITEFVGGNLFGPITRIFDSLSGGLKTLFGVIQGDTPLRQGLSLFEKFGKSLERIHIPRTAKSIIGFFRDISNFFSADIYEIPNRIQQVLGDAFSGFDFVFPVFDNIAAGIGGVFEEIGKRLNIGPIPDVFGALISPFEGLIGVVTGDQGAMTKLADFGNSISEFFGPAFEVASDVVGNLGDKLVELSEAFAIAIPEQAAHFFDFIDSIGQTVGPVAISILDGLAYAWGVLVDAVSNAGFSFDPFVDFFSSLGDVFTGLFSGDFKPEKIGEAIGGIFDSIGNLGSDISEPLGNVFKSVGDEIYNHLEGPLKDLAGWIGNIKNPLDDLGKGFSQIIDNITKPIKEFFGIVDDEGWKDIDGSEMVKSLSTAEENMDSFFNFFGAFDKLKEWIGSPITAVSEGISQLCSDISKTVFDVVNKIDPQAIDKAIEKIGTLGGIAASIYALYEFGKFNKALGGFLEAFGGLATALTKCVGQFEGILKAQKFLLQSKVIVNIALSLAVIVGAIIALALIGERHDLTPALIVVGGISAFLLILLALVSSTAKGLNAAAIATMDQIGDFIFKFGLSVAAIAALIAILGGMDPAELERGRNAMLAIIVIVTIMEALMMVFTMIPGEKDLGEVGNTMLKLVGSIAILVIISQYLGVIANDPNFQNGVGIMIGFAAGITIFLLIMGALGKRLEAAGTALIGISVLIVALTVAVNMLKDFKWEENAGGLLAAIAILAAAVAAVIVLTRFTKANDLGATAVSLIGISVAIGLLAAAIAGLALAGKYLGAENVMAAAAAVALLGVAMSVMIVALGTLKGLKLVELTAVFIGAAVAIDLLVAAVAALTFLIEEKKENVAYAILAMVAVIAAFTLAIVGVSAALTTFKVGGLIFIGIVAAIASALYAFGIAVDSITNFLNFLKENAPETFSKVGEAIGNFAESLGKQKDKISDGVSGALTGASDGMKKSAGPMGNDLIDTILTVLNTIKERGGELIGTAGAALVGVIVGVGDYIYEHKDEILEFVGKLLDAAGQAVVEFGQWLKGKIGEWFSWVSQNGAANPVSIYDMPESYVDPSTEVDYSGITNAANSATAKAATNSLSKGSNVEECKKQVSEDGWEIINTAAETSKEAIDTTGLANMITNAISGGMDASLPDLLAKAGEMGFEIPPEFQAGVESGAINMDNVGDIIDENGTFDFTKINQGMTEDGWKAVGSYDEGVEKAASNLNIAPYVAGEKQIDEDRIRREFGHAAKEGVQSFIDELKNINFDISPQVTSCLRVFTQNNAFKSEARAYGLSITRAFQDGLSDFSDKAYTAASNAKTRLKAGLTTADDEAKRNAKSIVDGFADALDDMSSKASSECTSTMTAMKDSFSNAYSSGSSLGSDFGKGLADGIESKYWDVVDAAQWLAENAEKEVRIYLEVKSPSKVARRIGGYFGMGLALGILGTADMVKNAAATLSGSAVGTLETTMSYVDALAEGIESNPVIRPVLDLTDYNAGLSAMGSLNAAPSAKAAGYIPRLMSTYSGQDLDQKASTNNVISITLNYDASADANQIVNDIAAGLASKLALEGV